jgi:2-alkenal reductase
MPDLPRTHREVRLAAKPADGLPKPEHFEIAEVALPVPGEGELLVRNRFFHVFAALRTLIGGSLESAPFPPILPGDTLFGAAIGEVVSAPEGTAFEPGDLVSHRLGWREYATPAAGQCTALPGTLPDPVAYLAPGTTAYGALTRGVAVQPGDTVFVSGAAGSVGSMAGQIARLLGAGRVIGSTGSREKGDRLVDELGYDAAVIRGAGPIAEQLAGAAPAGLDVVLDNVGGQELQAAVTAARKGARFVLVGGLSGQLSPSGTGTTAPVELDSFLLIGKQITMRGYSAGGNEEVRSQWLDRFAGWLRSGDITFPHISVPGIEAAPQALYDTMNGQYLGTVVVAL